jgi:hypothetical protein
MYLLSWSKTLAPPMHFYLTDILLRMPLFLVKSNQCFWFMVQLPNVCKLAIMRHDEKRGLRAFRRHCFPRLATLRNFGKTKGNEVVACEPFVLSICELDWKPRDTDKKKGGFRPPMLNKSMSEIIIYKGCVLGVFHLFL